MTFQTIFQISVGKLKGFTNWIFIVKNLTDFRKTVETGVDPRVFLVRHIWSLLVSLLAFVASQMISVQTN